MKQIVKIPFKELCETCFETIECEKCKYENCCDKEEYKIFLRKNNEEIRNSALKKKTYIIGDISTLVPSNFINYDTGEFMLDEDFGEKEIKYEIDND